MPVAQGPCAAAAAAAGVGRAVTEALWAGSRVSAGPLPRGLV